MYGGSGKLGRGGAGVVKRNIHAPPINRNSAAMSGSRLSSGGGSAAVPRGRDGGGEAASGPSTSARQAEETFSLVTGNPLNFAMALRLVPDLVEEINRVEAMGGTARIKFDSNANNANGNVINVGDKNFKFTWSREMGELCDIYEERKSDEDGNGLLIESGGAWRKLNVQRVLDESTKKHVKMRSEEAERKNKSRKSIVLDHQNSTMKNQMKALAAAESNSWRMPFKRKEPPFKKSKPEPSPGGPPKPVYKSGLSTTNPSKGRPSSGSPLSSQTDQYGAPAQPIGSSNLVKGFSSVPDATPSQTMNKIASVDKEMPIRLANSTVHSKPKHNQNVEAKPVDLRSFMISLLMETDGMNLRALEKAVADVMPNSVRQIQPVLKQIATFQAPGRYFLKPGVDLENFKKPSSGSGSSPEINWHRSPAPDKFDQLPDQDHSFSLRKLGNELEEQTQLNSVRGHTSETMEKIDVLNNSPDNSNGKKVSDNSEGQAGSSSDGGSDSDSESNSSDSGSDSESHSRGKSISPVGSRSGSSSDSESDVSSSSKQASDEDVDIMTSDDDKELKHKLQDSEPVSSKSPLELRPQDSEPIDIGNYEKLDDRAFDVVEIEKDDPEDEHEAEKVAANYLFSNEEGEEPIEEIRPPSANHHERNENQGYDRKLYGAQDSEVNVSFKHGHSDSYTRLSRGKSKRHSNDQHSVDRPDNSKKLKGKNLNQPLSGTINSLFGESPQNPSPDRPLQGPYKGSINQMANRAASDGTYDPSLQTGFDQGISTGSVSESQFPGQRSFDASGRAEAPYGEKRPGKRDNWDCGVEESERGLETGEGLWIRNQVDTGVLHNEGFVSERRPAKFSVEDVGDKNLTITESIPRKPKIMGKVKDSGRHSNTRKGYSPRDNDTGLMVRSPVMNGRNGILQRELSDLELGEFREPLGPDEISEPRKQFEKKGNSGQLENKPTHSECWNSDSHRGKPSKKISADSRKLSQENSDAAVSGIPDGPSKRKPLENYANDLPKPHLRETQPLPQQHQSSAVQTEFGSHQSKISEMSGKSRYVEADTVQRTNLETCGYKKMPVNAIEQQHGPKRAVVSNSTREGNMIGGSNDKRKDASSIGSYDVSQKRRESSSDERDCSYMKYEKEEPELKGSIKNLSEYKEYVKEFQEKYESYCSLNKILESYRDEFSKLGKDLEACRGRDDKRYHDLLGQMRSSFLQCGQKHKRLKKIFSVLHEELKHLKQMMRDYASSYTKD